MSLPINVVGVAFFQNKSLLISKSHNCRKNNKYTLVGGKIEPGESVISAALRECKEEIGYNFQINENDLVEIMEFTEVSASNPHQLIHLHVLISKKDIDVPLYTSKEIIDYRWFTLKDDIYILSPSIRNHLIDYAKENNLL